METQAISAAIQSLTSFAETVIESTTQVFLEAIVKPRAAAAAAYQDRLKDARTPRAQADGTQVGKYVLFASLGVLALIIILKVIFKNEK